MSTDNARKFIRTKVCYVTYVFINWMGFKATVERDRLKEGWINRLRYSMS